MKAEQIENGWRITELPSTCQVSDIELYYSDVCAMRALLETPVLRIGTVTKGYSKVNGRAVDHLSGAALVETFHTERMVFSARLTAEGHAVLAAIDQERQKIGAPW